MNEEGIMAEQISPGQQELIKGNVEKIFAVFQQLAEQKEAQILIPIEDVNTMESAMRFLLDRREEHPNEDTLHVAGARINRIFHDLKDRPDGVVEMIHINHVVFCVFGVSFCDLFLDEVAGKHIHLSSNEQYLMFIADGMHKHKEILSEFFPTIVGANEDELVYAIAFAEDRRTDDSYRFLPTHDTTQ